MRATIHTESPGIAGIHHLKLPVTDLKRSLEWYETVLGGVRQPHFDHFLPDGTLFAYILEVPRLGYPLELRLAPGMAKNMRGFDPIVFAVQGHSDLKKWEHFLTSVGIEHSGVLRGIIGWLLVFTDPDGLSIRLYTIDQHEVDHQNSDINSPWVAYPSETRLSGHTVAP